MTETANRPYHIYFALRDGYEKHVRKPAVVFTPSSDDRNDFTFKTVFRYIILDDSMSGPVKGDIYIGFRGVADDFRAKLLVMLESAPHGMLRGEEVPSFFTMLRSMQAYRDLVKRLGSELAKQLLIQINDLVALKHAGIVQQWYRSTITSDVFTLSFTRSAESFFAFHNAQSILDGIERESLRGISTDLHLSFQLPTFLGSHELDFHFEHESPLPKRIAVIIGENGVGKSQALSQFVKSLMAGDKRLRDSTQGRPLIHRLIAVASPGDTATTFPPAHTDDRIIYKRIILRRRMWGAGSPGFGETLEQLVRLKEEIRGQRRWDIFCEALSAVLDIEKIFVRVRRRTSSDAYATNWPRNPFSLKELQEGGEQQTLERLRAVHRQADVCRYVNGKAVPLSSGQVTFVRFAAEVCLNIENGTMVLFDEPETHLHPNLITEFVRLLDKLLLMTGSFAILATHSAYFVREVARSQVIVLKQSDNAQAEVLVPRLRTFGADIGEISHFVFEDELFGNLVCEVRQRLKHDPAQAAKYLKALEDELSTEAWMSLNREVPQKGKT